MAADWEEIRRLAADFQRAQFADTVQRLSERDCVEIIARLIQDKKLDVVHTLDGKEYITPAQITREIRDELYVHGGRVNIVELQQIINVDWFHVETRASDIAKTDKSVQLVLGQLIDDNYLNHLAEEVNDRLQEAGLIRIADLCKSYDLPGDFLTEELSKRLGRVIQGELDQYNRGIIFTPAFVARHTAKIRGIFSAITRPTPVTGMIGTFGLQGHLLHSVLIELVNTGRLKGSIVGGRRDTAVYIPDIYSKTQNTWVDSFLKQNGYLEFDALTRLGIPDPNSYIKKRFKSNKLLFLRAACVSQELVDQVEASIEEAVNSGMWTDIQDIGMLINQTMRNMNVQSTARLLGDTMVVTEKYISGCLSLFDDSIHQKAQKEVKSNPVLLITEEDLKQAYAVPENAGLSKKEKKEAERRKKTTEGSGSVKAGGGGNAREIRTRKTKKKGRKDDDSDEETRPEKNLGKKQQASFMIQEEIQSVLEERLADCPQDICSELAELLVRPLNKAYQEALQTLLLSSSSLVSGANKKSVKDMQEEITNLYNNIRLFEKGTLFFSEESQVPIVKHILKSVCTDVTNILVNFLAADLMMSVENPATITNEVRLKILGKLPDELKVPLMKLHNCLNGKSMEEFVKQLESSAEVCGFMLKKADKKKEKQALLLHRQTLTEQLKETEDPALVLHLTSVLLFQDSTHCILHAPGRCVPQIIGTLTGRIPMEKHQLLSVYQSLVVKQLTSQSQGRKQEVKDEAEEPDEETQRILTQFKLLTPQLKELVLSQKKTSTSDGVHQVTLDGSVAPFNAIFALPMKTEEDKDLSLLNMGGRVVRMLRNFNLENRVQREISKEKPRPAPRHAVTQAAFTPQEGNGGVVHQKNDPLLSNLKSVYVESTDTQAGTTKSVTKEEETKYRAAKFFLPGDSRGLEILTEVPQGKLTITEALKAVGSHQTEPQTWTSQRIAQEYSLDLKETNSLLEFFIPFQVQILSPETVKQLKSS